MAPDRGPVLETKRSNRNTKKENGKKEKRLTVMWWLSHIAIR